MRSRVAAAVTHKRSQRIARLTPAERIAIVVRLAEEGIASYMATHRVDRSTAIRRIKATHRLGRRASSSAVADER